MFDDVTLLYRQPGTATANIYTFLNDGTRIQVQHRGEPVKTFDNTHMQAQHCDEPVKTFKRQSRDSDSDEEVCLNVMSLPR